MSASKAVTYAIYNSSEGIGSKDDISDIINSFTEDTVWYIRVVKYTSTARDSHCDIVGKGIIGGTKVFCSGNFYEYNYNSDTVTRTRALKVQADTSAGQILVTYGTTSSKNYAYGNGGHFEIYAII